MQRSRTILLSLFTYVFIALCAVCTYAWVQQKAVAAAVKYFLCDINFSGAQIAFPRFGIAVYLLTVLWRVSICLLLLVLLFALMRLLYTRVAAVYNTNRKLVFKIISIAFTLLSIAGILAGAEWYLAKAGYYPGSYYRGFHPFATPDHTQLVWSDSLGINRNGKQDESKHINADGFPSVFDYNPATIDSLRKSGKKIVFVLGDSFTWGIVETHGKTFVEQLKTLNSQYAVLNFGAPGVDPLNYRLIAEQYIPLLKPDAVVVAFCGSNDFMNYDRLPAPFIPLFYNGSFGQEGNLAQSQIPAFLGGKPNQLFPTVDSLYNFYYHRFYIPALPNSTAFDRCCAHTRLTSFI